MLPQFPIMIQSRFCSLSVTSSLKCSIAFLLVLSGLLVSLHCANEEVKGIVDSPQLQLTSKTHDGGVEEVRVSNIYLYIFIISSLQVTESPSDNVNGVNADVPLGNDGDENVVGALSVDDSGTMKKRPQIAKSKRIIPFQFDNYDQSKNHSIRKKRNAQKIAIGLAIAFIVATVYNATVYFTVKSGMGNASSNSQKGYIDFMELTYRIMAVLVLVILFSLFMASRRTL